MNSMIKILIEMVYRVFSTMFGFLTHPYQTMQGVVERHIPIGFIFFPLMLCLFGWFVAREFSGLFLWILPLLGVWWFLEVWWLTFWMLWQITLLYLFWRFSLVRE